MNLVWIMSLPDLTCGDSQTAAALRRKYLPGCFVHRLFKKKDEGMQCVYTSVLRGGLAPRTSVLIIWNVVLALSSEVIDCLQIH